MARLVILSFGICYFWFGLLKFFPGISPAETLAGDTINLLTFGLLSPTQAVFALAIGETLIGLGCFFNLYPKLMIRLILLHMIGTFTPMFLFPDLVYGDQFFSLTLVGQYIIKNLVFVSALLMIFFRSLSEKETEEASQQEISHEKPVKPLSRLQRVSSFLMTIFIV